MPTERLLYASTTDGLRHAGLVIRPDGEPRSLAVLWIHGFTGRFHEPHAIAIGRALAGRGYTFVAGDNRGRDLGAIRYPDADHPAPTLIGAGWELWDESPHDVDAWVTLIAGLGFARVILLGHSFGALKAVYYQAQRQDPRVAGLVAASGPANAWQLDTALLAEAERMVAAGRGRDLLPWDALWSVFPISAQTYLSYRRADLDIFGVARADPPLGRIRCPLFAFYGTDEQWVGGSQDLALIRRNASAAASVQTCMFEGADHVYTGQELPVASAVADWLDALKAPADDAAGGPV